MGKSAGQAPQAPDPEKVIPLQTAANKETFDYALNGSRYNTNTPNGSQSWNKDPKTGQWTLDNTLSAGQQQLFDTNQASQTQQAQLLSALTGRLGGTLGQPIDYSGIPGMQSDIGSPTLSQNNLQSPNFQQIGGGANLVNPSFGQVTPGAIPKAGGDPSSYGQYSPDGLATTQAPDASGYGRYNLDTGSQLAAPGSTAQRESIDPSGKVATPGAVIQDRSGGLQSQLAQYLTQMSGLKPGEFNQQSADAVYGQATRYLDPQVKQQQQGLEARLAEQGFVPGTPGYTRAMEQLQSTNAQSYADARDRATTQGFNVGQNNFNSSLGNIQAQIAAALGGANFGLNNDSARSAEGFNRAGFESGQNQQDFGQRMANAQFGANRDDALFGQNMQGANYAADQQNQQFSRDLGAGNFNAAQDQADFSRRLSSANFGAGQNQAKFTAGMQQAGLGMQQDAADFSRRNDAASLAAGFQNQDFNQQNTLANQQRQGSLDANAVAQQLYQNQTGATSANNALAQQGFQNQSGQIQQNNQTAQQQQGLNQNAAAFNNQARMQQIAEMLQQRLQPLNELNALRSGTQATLPQGTSQGGAPGMANTDVMGAYNQQYQGQMDAYNARVGSNNSLMGGLAGLGGAALGNIGELWPILMGISDRRLKDNIRQIGKTPGGANIYAYTIFGREETGVMAQELLDSQPDAVSVEPTSGFYQVDYGKVQ